jgi:hypothetical protein
VSLVEQKLLTLPKHMSSFPEANKHIIGIVLTQITVVIITFINQDDTTLLLINVRKV